MAHPWGVRVPRRLTRFACATEGVAAVEFALVALPFFALLFAILETALVFLAGHLFEDAVQEASRLVRTGQVRTATVPVATLKDGICSRIPILIRCSANDPNLHVDVIRLTAFSASTDSAVQPGGEFNAERYDQVIADDIVLVRAFYKFPLVVNGFGIDLADIPGSPPRRLLGAAATFRNEPF